MQINDIIEGIVTRELKALCGTCLHRHECVYYRTSTKAVIQCELFEPDREQIDDFNPRQGLCTTCGHANHCTLPARIIGAWRCSEFSED